MQLQQQRLQAAKITTDTWQPDTIMITKIQFDEWRALRS
jgi:hypothetical protein